MVLVGITAYDVILGSTVPYKSTKPAVKHPFFCLGWLEQKQIRTYISEQTLNLLFDGLYSKKISFF